MGEEKKRQTPAHNRPGFLYLSLITIPAHSPPHYSIFDFFFFIFTKQNKKSVNHRREIIICLGSSCFSRGNRNLLKIIQRFINHHGLADKVFFRGDHCFGECSEGPNIKIDGKVFNHVSEENIQQILKESLQDLFKTGG